MNKIPPITVPAIHPRQRARRGAVQVENEQLRAALSRIRVLATGVITSDATAKEWQPAAPHLPEKLGPIHPLPPKFFPPPHRARRAPVQVENEQLPASLPSIRVLATGGITSDGSAREWQPAAPSLTEKLGGLHHIAAKFFRQAERSRLPFLGASVRSDH